MAPALGFLLPNEKVEQLAANRLTIPQDAIASLLQRLVRPFPGASVVGQMGIVLTHLCNGLPSGIGNVLICVITILLDI